MNGLDIITKKLSSHLMQQLACGRSESKPPETLNFHKLALPVATLRQ